MHTQTLRIQRLYEASTVFLALIIMSGALGALVLFIPLFAIWTYHRRKLAEIKVKQNISIAEETRAAIAALRKEISTLRDTATEYDLSFDTALKRIESRMANMEQRVGKVEQEIRTAQVNRS
jgi:cell division septal protein FtsQ